MTDVPSYEGLTVILTSI